MSKETFGKKVLVAMSGGVDSSVAAALLLEQGYRVVGVHLKFWSEEGTEQRQNVCCSLESEGDAKRVCDVLGIPFQVWNIEDIFYREVVEYYLTECSNFRTPNPCVVCNQKIKLGWLVDKAVALGFDYVATGHWARVSKRRTAILRLGSGQEGEKITAGRYTLKQAKNKEKDQSYFLYRLTQEKLVRLLFPLGNFTSKEAVRTMAAQRNLPVSAKKESQEICFIPDGDRARFLNKHAPGAVHIGEVQDMEGNVLGKHSGLALYTEGQRRGVGIAGGERLYVVEKNKKENVLVLGAAEHALRDGVIVSHIHWLDEPEAKSKKQKLACRMRYNSRAVSCRLEEREDGTLSVHFDREIAGVAPGQSAVFYTGEEVLGGGTIESSFRVKA